MISRVHSSILQGIDAIGCEVEADVAIGGMGEIKLVGMAEMAVKESVSRIQAALRNSGYRWPGPKTTINLAPADVKKESAAYDLPIALVGGTTAGLRAGRHVRYGKGTPLANLWVTTLGMMDITVDSFGDSNGVFEHLTDIA